MAKQPTKGGTSRIRFIMVEAEIADGDLGQITAAIQNALKPAPVISSRVTPQLAANTPANGEIIADEVEDVEEQEIEVTQRTSTKAPRTRKTTTPNVLDLELTKKDVPLAEFAAKHSADSEPDRNLVVAAWFKEHGDVGAVTASHVYTAYRHLGWPAGFDDFSWPLRNLKKSQLMVPGSGRGEYVINHLGIDRVIKMANA